jgi:phosphinothricin acetyltransferase
VLRRGVQGARRVISFFGVLQQRWLARRGGKVVRMPIRDATAADLDAIFAIYDRVVLHGTATFETVVRTPRERAEWFAAHDRSLYPVVVADEGGRIGGWARLYPWSPRPAYIRTAENAVYVDEAHRGRGLGRALMEELIRRARASGVIKNIVARVVVGNPASAGLHRALGYQTIGVMRRVGEKFGRVLDVELMDLHLE